MRKRTIVLAVMACAVALWVGQVFAQSPGKILVGSEPPTPKTIVDSQGRPIGGDMSDLAGQIADQKIKAFKNALKSGDPAAVNKAAVDLRSDNTAVKRLNNSGQTNLINAHRNAMDRIVKTTENLSKQGIADAYNQQNNLKPGDKGFARPQDVTYEKFTNPKPAGAAPTTGYDTDITPRVHKKDYYVNPKVNEVINKSFHTAAGGERTFGIKSAETAAHDAKIEVVGRHSQDAYESTPETARKTMAGGRPTDPQQVAEAAKIKIANEFKKADALRKAGDLWGAHNAEVKGFHEAAKQYGNLVESQVKNAGGKVPGHVAEGMKIIQQVESGALSPAEGRAKLGAMRIPETPSSMGQKAMGLIESAPKLKSPTPPAIITPNTPGPSGDKSKIVKPGEPTTGPKSTPEPTGKGPSEASPQKTAGPAEPAGKGGKTPPEPTVKGGKALGEITGKPQEPTSKSSASAQKQDPASGKTSAKTTAETTGKSTGPTSTPKTEATGKAPTDTAKPESPSKSSASTPKQETPSSKPSSKTTAEPTGKSAGTKPGGSTETGEVAGKQPTSTPKTEATGKAPADTAKTKPTSKPSADTPKQETPSGKPSAKTTAEPTGKSAGTKPGGSAKTGGVKGGATVTEKIGKGIDKVVTGVVIIEQTDNILEGIKQGSIDPVVEGTAGKEFSDKTKFKNVQDVADEEDHSQKKVGEEVSQQLASKARRMGASKEEVKDAMDAYDKGDKSKFHGLVKDLKAKGAKDTKTNKPLDAGETPDLHWSGDKGDSLKDRARESVGKIGGLDEKLGDASGIADEEDHSQKKVGEEVSQQLASKARRMGASKEEVKDAMDAYDKGDKSKFHGLVKDLKAKGAKDTRAPKPLDPGKDINIDGDDTIEDRAREAVGKLGGYNEKLGDASGIADEEDHSQKKVGEEVSQQLASKARRMGASKEEVKDAMDAYDKGDKSKFNGLVKDLKAKGAKDTRAPKPLDPGKDINIDGDDTAAERVKEIGEVKKAGHALEGIHDKVKETFEQKERTDALDDAQKKMGESNEQNRRIFDKLVQSGVDRNEAARAVREFASGDPSKLHELRDRTKNEKSDKISDLRGSEAKTSKIDKEKLEKSPEGQKSGMELAQNTKVTDSYDKDRSRKSKRKTKEVQDTAGSTQKERGDVSQAEDQREKTKIKGQGEETDRAISSSKQEHISAEKAAEQARQTAIGTVIAGGFFGGLSSGVGVGLDNFFGGLGKGAGEQASVKMGIKPKPTPPPSPTSSESESQPSSSAESESQSSSTATSSPSSDSGTKTSPTTESKPSSSQGSKSSDSGTKTSSTTSSGQSKPTSTQSTKPAGTKTSSTTSSGQSKPTSTQGSKPDCSEYRRRAEDLTSRYERGAISTAAYQGEMRDLRTKYKSCNESTRAPKTPETTTTSTKGPKQPTSSSNRVECEAAKSRIESYRKALDCARRLCQGGKRDPQWEEGMSNKIKALENEFLQKCGSK